MSEIVSNLFGLNPDQARMQQMQNADADAMAYAKMDNWQRADYGIGKGAGMLGGMLAERMGGVDPAVQEAENRQRAMYGGDLSTSAGLRAAAERMLQVGDQQRAWMLSQLADKKDAEDADLGYKQAQTASLRAPKSEKISYGTEVVPISSTMEQKFETVGGRVDMTKPIGKPRPIFSPSDRTSKAPDVIAQESGRESVSTIIAQLRDAYTQLKEGGGVTDPNSGGASNLVAGIASSGLGQATGRLFGTKNQSKRNEILMTRPALLAHIMKATGMSAKQMDSNTELKLWLSTATDPTLDISANMQALDNIENTYGVKEANLAGQPSPQEVHEKMPNPKNYSGKVMTDTKTGIKYKSSGARWVRQ